MGWGGGERLLEFDWEEEGGGCFFQVGANSRLDDYLNKNGISKFTDLIEFHLICQIFAKFSFGPYLSLSK